MNRKKAKWEKKRKCWVSKMLRPKCHFFVKLCKLLKLVEHCARSSAAGLWSAVAEFPNLRKSSWWYALHITRLYQTAFRSVKYQLFSTIGLETKRRRMLTKFERKNDLQRGRVFSRSVALTKTNIRYSVCSSTPKQVVSSLN